jgi:hypothetical protein
MLIQAREIELGDVYRDQRVTGWYFNGRGRVMIEYANRWHTHHAGEAMEVERQDRQPLRGSATGTGLPR